MRKLNSHIYDLLADLGMSMPDIPVFAVEYFGQCGEDLIVASLARAVALREGIDLSGQQYLEIGANHPVSTSATYLLHRMFGMTGILVEANPRLLPDLRRFRPQDRVLHAAVQTERRDRVPLYVSRQNELSSLDRRFVDEWKGGSVGMREVVSVPSVRINDLMQAHFGTSGPLFLSIDIEGLDLDVLRDLDWDRWRPALVQTEPSEHHHPGNTASLASFLTTVGYVVVCRTEVNLIALDAGRTGLVEREMALGVISLPRELASALHSAEQKSASLTQVESELAKAQETLQSAKNELAEALDCCDALRSSTSWRMTQPVRALVGSAKRFLRHVRRHD